MLRKLALAVAVASALVFPAQDAFAAHGGHGGGGHGGGGHGGFHGGGFHGGGFHGGGYHGGGYHGGGRGRFWGGRWYGYGVGPCWRWNPFFGQWIWICG